MLETQLSEIQKEYADLTQVSAKFLLNLISDILQLSEVRKQAVKLEVVEFDLWDMLEGVVDTVGTKALEQNLEFGLFINKNCPRR